MKQTSRKKVLLSSVAMMMVATVSLSSATYAWFSTKTTATAEGVNVKTSQASSLVLSLDQEEWKSTIDLGINNGETGEKKGAKNLEPGSTADLSNWFTATSTGYDQGSVDTTTITSGKAGTNYVAKTFYLKSIGNDLTVDWNIIFDENQVATDKNYMRTAMTITDTETNQVFWWSDNGETTKALTSTGVSDADVTTSAAVTGKLAKLTKDKVYTMNLYVWFEGQDAQCIDTKAGTVCDFDVQFTKSAVQD